MTGMLAGHTLSGEGCRLCLLSRAEMSDLAFQAHPIATSTPLFIGVEVYRGQEERSERGSEHHRGLSAYSSPSFESDRSVWYCPDPLLPIRSPAVQVSLNSPPVSMLGLPQLIKLIDVRERDGHVEWISLTKRSAASSGAV